MFPIKYPYSNFHELNLDWILSEMQRFGVQVDKIPETIETVAKELLDGANIENIIAEYVRTSDRENYRNTRRIFRTIRKNTNNKDGADTDFFSQGMAYDGDFFYVAGINNLHECTIHKITLDGEEVASVNIGDSHANDMTIAGDYLYIVDTKDSLGHGANTISKVFTPTMTYNGRKPLGNYNSYLSLIAYDPDKEKILCGIPGKLFEIVEGSAEYVITGEINVNNKYGEATQGIAINKGILYTLCVNPDMIVATRMNSNAIIEFYAPPEYMEKMYPYGELEGIAVLKNGNIAVSSWQACGEYCNQNIYQFFEIEYGTPVIMRAPFIDHGGKSVSAISVNANSTSNNPDGVNYPFKWLSEAAMIVNSPALSKVEDVKYNVAPGIYDSADFSSAKNVSVIGSGNAIAGNIYCCGGQIYLDNMCSRIMSNNAISNFYFLRAKATTKDCSGELYSGKPIFKVDSSLFDIITYTRNREGFNAYDQYANNTGVFLSLYNSNCLVNMGDSFRCVYLASKNKVNSIPVMTSPVTFTPGQTGTIPLADWLGKNGNSSITDLFNNGATLKIFYSLRGSNEGIYYTKSNKFEIHQFNIADTIVETGAYEAAFEIDGSNNAIKLTRFKGIVLEKAQEISYGDLVVNRIEVVFE